jgi:hypothetical protein
MINHLPLGILLEELIKLNVSLVEEGVQYSFDLILTSDKCSFS